MGIWQVPEAQLGMLPEDVAGLDAIELGCGTAYVSAWLARRGARPVGIDNSPEQLATARRMQAAHGLAFPLHLGNAEATPFPDASFDLAISEYGAAIWCDPHRWILESTGVEFHISHGEWIRLLRCSGFEVEDLIEVYPPDGATSKYPFVDLACASAWPSEEIWKVRKRR